LAGIAALILGEQHFDAVAGAWRRNTLSPLFQRFLPFAVLVLVGAFVAEPYLRDFVYTAPAPRPIEPRAELSDFERSTISVFDRDSPSVVQIAGEVTSAETGRAGTQTGSGFVWDGAGHIVTNNHVVQGATGLFVRLSSGEVIRAEVVGTAPSYDLAVVKITTHGKLPPPLALGSSADLKVGQMTYAIGNPFGLDETMTTGIVSALKRRLPTSGGREVAGVIQTDAPINPGNSGGPLLDSAGRLIGVTTAILSPSGTNSGIGFAIPVDVVNRIVPELIRAGHVPTPGIGIVAADESQTAELGIEGVVIVEVMPNSPAARAGLRGLDPRSDAVGDVIIDADGAPVRRLADLTDQLERAGVGNAVELKVVSGSSTKTIRVEVADISRQPS
jgi:2-alkenal reductase